MPGPRARPQMTRIGARREHRDIGVLQIRQFVADDPEIARVLRVNPKLIEQAITVQGIPLVGGWKLRSAAKRKQVQLGRRTTPT